MGPETGSTHVPRRRSTPSDAARSRAAFSDLNPPSVPTRPSVVVYRTRHVCAPTCSTHAIASSFSLVPKEKRLLTRLSEREPFLKNALIGVGLLG